MQEKSVSSAKWRVSPLSIALIGLFVALTTVGAYVKIPGPLVPFTAQFFFCTIGGVLLGAKRGFAAQCIYLVLGLLGLPLFTGGGGIGYVFQPTFGYLIGFALSALLAGLVCDRLMKRKGKISFLAMLFTAVGCLAVVYLFGVSYYLLLQNVYFGQNAQLGYALSVFVLPFLLTDFLWCLLLAGVAPRIRKAVQKYL